jgi:hypothetical protein
MTATSNTPPTNATGSLPAVNFADLEKAVASAATIGKALVADQYHGASQFAAGIRAALENANNLIALQKQWIADNPPSK